MPPQCPTIPSSRSASPDPKRRDRSLAITFDPLPEQSVRTALILDRFSTKCNVFYCSNDSLISTTSCMGRSFFDFVSRKDEDLVRSWINAIKSWDVNERGQPSDGGFGFGKFNLLVRGRDSRCVRFADALRPVLEPCHFCLLSSARILCMSGPQTLIRVPFYANRQLHPVPSRHRNGHPAAADTHSKRDRDHRERDQEQSRESRIAAPRARAEEEKVVDVIFSAHSDGLIVILRPSSS